MDTFTIEEIKTYIRSQDSLGDVMYNLTAENIRKANDPDPEDELDNIEGNMNELDETDDIIGWNRRKRS